MSEIFKVIKKEKSAKLGKVKTVHGVFKTPCFMNVATAGAIKGAVSSLDLKQIKCQVQLSNTYHLHIHPGDEIIKNLGGLHKFTRWEGPILTDSGGFQVFSLAKIREIDEKGVFFNSHFNGKKIFMGPEESIKIQSNLGSTIAMAFDECIAFPSTYSYTEKSCERTLRWLERCKKTMESLNSKKETINKKQLLFGINQGLTFKDIRKKHMKQIVSYDCDGYAIGGLSVGEPKQDMFNVLEEVIPIVPKNKPIYLMGVGTLQDILNAVSLGVDMFDCVMPSRNARHGNVNSWQGVLNLLNKKYEKDPNPIDFNCECCVCKNFSRAYLRHLFKAKEMLAFRLCTLHNLFFYNNFLEEIRKNLKKRNFFKFKERFLKQISKRI